MDAIVLTVLACLAASPAECREHVTPLEPGFDVRLPMPCVGAMAEWAVEHPQWVVRRFRCSPVERIL